MKQIVLHGADLSHHNAFAQKADGTTYGMKDLYMVLDFVMLKAGGYENGRFYKDDTFDARYEEAKEAGLYVGAYFYIDSLGSDFFSLYAAVYFSSLMKGKQFEMPVVLDMEGATMENYPNDVNTYRACIFCEALEMLGYYVSIYGSDVSVFKDRYVLSNLQDYDKWVARYGKEPEYVPTYGMYQYTSNGLLPALYGDVDLDYAYLYYPEIMANKNLNGF